MTIPRLDRTSLVSLIGLALAACSFPPPPPVEEDPPIDAPVETSPGVVGLVPAAGRIQGGAFVLDVQIGHAVDPRTATGDTLRLEGAAAIK